MWLYWLLVFPRARRELAGWRRRANAIADPTLRALALGKLTSERLVAEGAAAFAVLASRRWRRDVIRVAVAYEVLYDLLDAIGEQPVADPLAHNRRVHAALGDALAPSLPRRAPGVRSTDLDDPYLRALVATCRASLARLPAHCVVLSALGRFAARAAEAQSLNHAGALDDHRGLARWAASQRVPDARWWEVAAAASDPLGVYALIAAASHQRTSPHDVAAIEHGYFPWVGALVWLLESLVDQREDRSSGNHSYVARYGSGRHAARRLAVLARRAGSVPAGLPHGPHHAVLLAGVVSLYLSDPAARERDVHAASGAVRDAIRGPVGPLLRVLQLRRRLWLGLAGSG